MGNEEKEILREILEEMKKMREEIDRIGECFMVHDGAGVAYLVVREQ